MLESGAFRETLSTNRPTDRPASGAELAGRLQLALHPEAGVAVRPAARSVGDAGSSPAPLAVADDHSGGRAAAEHRRRLVQLLLQRSARSSGRHNRADANPGLYIEGIEPFVRARSRRSSTRSFFPLGGAAGDRTTGWPVTPGPSIRAKRGEAASSDHEIDAGLRPLPPRRRGSAGHCGAIASLVFPVGAQDSGSPSSALSEMRTTSACRCWCAAAWRRSTPTSC